MKIKDIILETTDIPARYHDATVGLNQFTDGDKWNSDYTLYRLGLAVAETDGVTPPKMDSESWVGRWKSTAPYTKQEQDMLKLAYKTVHAEYKDLNNGDMRSKEGPTINKTSPIPSKKKNKYGV